MDKTVGAGVPVILFLVVWSLTGHDCLMIDGKLFQEDLRHLADDILGAGVFQTYLNKEVDYETSRLLGNDLLNALTISLEDKLQARVKAVINLRNTIEREFGSLPKKHYAESCCRVAMVGNPDSRFGDIKINPEYMCSFGKGYSNPSPYLNERILDVMKENLRRVPSLKSQYFGSEHGLLTIYPARRKCDDIYDPRFRPWYVETVTPDPKDVVVVIDTSASMRTDNLMTIAIQAAAAVIDTLNPNDRVGVVAFSDDARMPPGTSDTSHCYKTELAKASPQNKNYLKQYVHALYADGDTFYSKALQSAFSLFIETEQISPHAPRKRDRVILFLTDGRPTEPHENIWRVISEGNAALNNTVIILTFGLGKAIQKAEDKLLLDIAEQVQSDPDYGEIKSGRYTKVSSSSNLRYDMTSYYNIFSRTGRIPTPVFSVPYFDAKGLGLVTSACLPVFHNIQIQGVTCVDISLGDLLSDITYFQGGEFSYAFMINGYGRIVSHPQMPKPSETYDDPVFVSMTVLESFDESQDVMESMMRGETGNGTFISTRVRARGNSDVEGVIVWSQQCKYYWKPVTGTNFSVCLVIGEGDEQAQPKWDEPYHPDSFIYHVLHLQTGIKTCNFFNQLVLQDKTAVSLMPDVFEEPFNIISHPLTFSDVTKYRKYLTGKTNINPGFKKGIRETVAVTYKLEEIVANTQGYKHAVWLYIGTENGVYRQYPGIRNPLRYNHKKRPWYQKAMGQKDRYTMSSPYWDASGTGWIITLAVVIYEGRQVETPPPMGVMAIDFPVTYFYDLLVARYSICQNEDIECTVIDKSGFLVVHKEFTSDVKAKEVENIHITAKDPYIANELINAGIMRKETCLNHQHFRYQKYWTVAIKSSTGNLIKSDYEVHALENSNIFIIIKQLPQDQMPVCRCHTKKSLEELSKCTETRDKQFCECPCYSPLMYNFCRAIFARTSDKVPSCMPDAPPWKIEAREEDAKDLSSRPMCYDLNCPKKKTKNNCMRVLGCTWCTSRHRNICVARQDCSSVDNAGSTLNISLGTAVSILILLLT